VDYRTALDQAIHLLENPISTWVSAETAAKHRLFFLLFEGRLEYSAEEGFRTGKSLSSTRLFEEFSHSEPNWVHSNEKSSNRLREYLRRVWVHRDLLIPPPLEAPETNGA